MWHVSSCFNSGRRNICTRTSRYSWQNFWLVFVKSRIKMSARRTIIVTEFPLFFSLHPCMCWNWNSKQATTTSFQILSSTLFAVHPVIRCCVILTDNKCKWVQESFLCWIHALLLVAFCKTECRYFFRCKYSICSVFVELAPQFVKWGTCKKKKIIMLRKCYYLHDRILAPRYLNPLSSRTLPIA